MTRAVPGTDSGHARPRKVKHPVDTTGTHRLGRKAEVSGGDTMKTRDATAEKTTDPGHDVHQRGTEIVDIRNFRGTLNTTLTLIITGETEEERKYRGSMNVTPE